MKATLREPAQSSEIHMDFMPVQVGHKGAVLPGNFASSKPKPLSLY